MVDITRSIGVFNPEKIKDNIHVIGVGATGSHLVRQLVLHGVPGDQINVYDFDTVEEHNLHNQYFRQEDVGKLKVDALKDRLISEHGISINTYSEKVETCQKMSGIVFLLIDGDRKSLFSSMVMQPRIRLVVETGVDARACRVCLLSPINLSHINYFKEKYLTDETDMTEVSVCGSRQVVSTTVNITSSIAMNEFIKFVNDPTYTGQDTFVSLDPLFLYTKKMTP